jgi:hypothetical protein
MNLLEPRIAPEFDECCVTSGRSAPIDEKDEVRLANFVLTRNFHRHQLSPGQRAMIVAEPSKIWKREHGGDRTNRKCFRLKIYR